MTQHRDSNFREIFTLQVQRNDNELELDLAALYLAGEEYTDLDVSYYIGMLDRMAEEVRALTARGDGARDSIEILNRYLFDSQGFSGNANDYYSPDNSFLNRVLETRRGIPITLSIVYLEICRRLGISAHGVGLPGHFVIMLRELDLFLDPFNGGQILSTADCRRLLENMFGSGLSWRSQYVERCTKHAILFRMLTNLRAIYARDRDFPRAVGVLERMTLINPAPWIYRELAWCCHQIGDRIRTLQYIEQYLESEGSTPEDEVVRQEMLSLRNSISRSG